MNANIEKKETLEPLALRPAAAAKLISVSVTSLWRYEHTGKIKAVPGTGMRHGRAKLFAVEELKRFVRGEANGTPAA